MFSTTKLSPLEEVLFKAWTKANGIEDPDSSDNFFDFRGLYKQTGGQVQPYGVVKSIADAHNAGVASQEEAGDVEFPDPYMAQAEMHKANLDSHAKQRSDMIKVQLEQKRMEHSSAEKDKDRAFKLQVEQMKAQQKVQQDEMNRQARAQEAEAARQAHAQEAQANREAGMQDSLMQEHFERTRPQPEPAPNPDLSRTLMSRMMSDPNEGMM